MGKIRTGHSTSLDGFIAGPNDGSEIPMGEGGEQLLAWYSGGDTEYRLPGTEMVQGLAAERRAPSRDARNYRVVGDGTEDVRPHRRVGWQTPLGRSGLRCYPHGSTGMELRRVSSRSSRTASRAP